MKSGRLHVGNLVHVGSQGHVGFQKFCHMKSAWLTFLPWDCMWCAQAAMKTLRDDVLDAPPHTCAALVAFSIGPLPQPQDRAGDGATSGGAARAKRKAGKRKCSDELLQSVQDCAGVTPCSSSSHAVGDAEKGCGAVGEPATHLRAPEGEGGRLRVACEAQEPNFAGDEDRGALREQVAAAGELCSDGRTLISV